LFLEHCLIHDQLGQFHIAMLQRGWYSAHCSR